MNAERYFLQLRQELDNFGPENLVSCPKCGGTNVIEITDATNNRDKLECQSKFCRPDKEKAGYRFSFTSQTLLSDVREFDYYYKAAEFISKNLDRKIAGSEIKTLLGCNVKTASRIKDVVYRAMLPTRIAVGARYQPRNEDDLLRRHYKKKRINFDPIARVCATGEFTNGALTSIKAACYQPGEDARAFLNSYYITTAENPSEGIAAIPAQPDAISFMWRPFIYQSSDLHRAWHRSKHRDVGYFLCTYMLEINKKFSGLEAMDNVEMICRGLVVPRPFEVGDKRVRAPGYGFLP